MLQQMSSTLCMQIDEVAAGTRYFDVQTSGDVSSGASSDTAEDIDLPQCKIKRNYNCTKCNFYTQNPRAFLIHSRDVHLEKIKIYDCPHCLYASRHHQKLLRHVRMVHTNPNNDLQSAESILVTPDQPEVQDPQERFDDMLEEVEDDIEMDEEEILERTAESSVSSSRPNQRILNSKKDNYFSCIKCNYVTHIRSRFTKHVKYHSMPMIKCALCDFRTPYKWNLDRHMKNHGGTGSFYCSMCNFTADIKQSLTVHEMNHHTPPVGQSPAGRRRNRVGASDSAVAVTAKEEEGSGDSEPVVDMGGADADIELISCNSESNDAMDVSSKMEDSSNDTSEKNNELAEDSKKQSRKPARPIPQLIPLGSSTPAPPGKTTAIGEPPAKKFKEDHKDNSNVKPTLENVTSDITVTPVPSNHATNKEPIARKKNNSFFDKLKERLLTETGEKGTLTCKNCGFESKCLSEHSVHEKNCTAPATKQQVNATTTSTLGSTRCQHCRHRCKSSADLVVHLQTCSKSNEDKKVETQQSENNDKKSNLETDNSEPHPMENVVFVWNNINTEESKFSTPLGININDDSTLPETTQNYDPENADENDGMILSPTQAIGKKVFKCPQCAFWASTASRFHVHIVGHLNKKPFECSLCKYKSNWRWDITKHIKLKSARDSEHHAAKVLMTDETGRRNYSKYNKYLAVPIINETGQNELIYVDPEAAESMDMEESVETHGLNDHQPLNLQTNDEHNKGESKPKRTLWKCKKCNYKDPSKEALLEHVKEHPKTLDEQNYEISKKLENTKDPNELAYRCGHCNQLSNWKHVIQRHCRLKHEGVVNVIAVEKPKMDEQPMILSENQPGEYCTKCPFKSNDKKGLVAHMIQHSPSPQSIFKCYFCPFFVKNEPELLQHLPLHGIVDPEEFISKTMGGGGGSPVSEAAVQTKRHKCTECPYETNSKSQYMYHEQFHRLSSDTPYKCQECNYSVSKRHLLHQHMRVHGIVIKKDDNEATTSNINEAVCKDEKYEPLEEIPYVWVSAKNEFHKMYKCRYCSYVNTQKNKIPIHEKVHILSFEDESTVIYKCLECKFTCYNAGKLTQHSKAHFEIYGRIYCPVKADVPDEEQIQNLRKIIEEEKNATIQGTYKDDAANLKDFGDSRQLLFCSKCPTRFFYEMDYTFHIRFHGMNFPHKCLNCDFASPFENQLKAHSFVHTDNYQSKTKILKAVHDTHPGYKEPALEHIHSMSSFDMVWVVPGVLPKSENILKMKMKLKKVQDVKLPKQACDECPAKFFKYSALSYHKRLHGSDGEHKCKKCTYAVKNIGNLAKHESLHEAEIKTPICDYDSGEDVDFKNIPLSGTDLFHRKTEAQKRVSTEKTKLVKPNDHFPPVLQADPQFGYLMHGNPEFIYPTYLKNGRQKEKRYKCHKCPSAFEKREQYKIHLSLHGSKQRYKCEICDYSVKYYANYVQHMRKHQMNNEAQAERKKDGLECYDDIDEQKTVPLENNQDIKLAIKTMPKSAPRSDFQQFSVCDQQILRLLQHRRSINGANEVNPVETPVKERRLHLCTLCPYVNQRQDGLQNHYRRHDKEDLINAGYNKCPHCDLAVVQSNFLRDHIKTHFIYNKNSTASCYTARDSVTFTISKVDVDEEDNNKVKTELKLSALSKDSKSNADKIFVKLSTGEIIAE